MNNRNLLVGLLVLTAVVTLTGCGQSAAAESAPTDQVPVVPYEAENTVTAEAVIEPARWSELRFDTGGEVAQMLVSPGDRVADGAPLLRLDTAALELSLQSAQQDVVTQKAALDQLIKGASEAVIARAERENAQQIAQAEIALQVKQLQLDKAHAEDPAANVTTAQARVKQLKLQLAQMQAEPIEADLALAQSAVDSAQAQLDQLLANPDAETVEIARLNWELAKNSLWQTQLERDAVVARASVPNYQKELAKATVGAAEVSASIAQLNYELTKKGAADETVRAAQAAVRQAQAQRDQALGAQKMHLISLDILQVQIDEAEEQLTQAIEAQETYTLTLDMLAAEVETARLELKALKEWENPYLDKASDEEIAQAQARLRQAELAVDQLEFQLQDAELSAPFAGTVVDVLVETGDLVSPGQMVIVLATLDRLQVRTIDLTELQVAQVAVGQAATVCVDALSDQEFAGLVQEVGLRGGDYRGDVVYDVTVDLTDPEATKLLRWGMTAMVKIQTK
jgi:multidrug efflux pump subunit AcrA (membrane-fusion protein)